MGPYATTERSRNAARKRKADEHSSVQPDIGRAKRTFKDGCAVCRVDMLIEIIERVTWCLDIPDISCLWQTDGCQFCEFLRQFFYRAFHGDDIDKSLSTSIISCRLYLKGAENDMHLRRTGVSLLPQVNVVLFNGDRSELPSKDRNTIDILLRSSDLSNASQPFHMQRLPLRAKFEVDQLRGWLRDCENGHRHRRQSPANDHFTRLVEYARFRLINVREKTLECASLKERYLTLSYVWGASIERCTATKISQTPLEIAKDSLQLDMDALPQTIKDAIDLVQAMGEQYLWVDAICIDQGNPEDKEVNLAAMSSIYGRSILTIVAASGADSDAGLSRMKTSGQVCEQAVVVQSQGQTIELLPGRSTLPVVLDSPDCPWNTRAWTYQEWLLSHRCVFFTGDEAFFTCPQGECRESYALIRSGNKAVKRSSAGKKPSLHDAVAGAATMNFPRFCELVEGYSRRNLTFPGDRLDAFTALLDLFIPRGLPPAEAEISKCGLPLEMLYNTLTWKAQDASEPGLRRLEYDSRRQRYFPSWSWLGWTGPICWQETIKGNYHKADYQALKFEVVDEYNLVGQPRWENEFWEPWPIQPTPCQSNIRGCVTLHLWARVEKLYLRPVSLEQDLPYVLYGAYTAKDGGNLRTTARIDSAFLESHGLDQPVGAIYFYRVYKDYTSVVLTACTDGISTRVSQWCEELVWTKHHLSRRASQLEEPLGNDASECLERALELNKISPKYVRLQ